MKNETTGAKDPRLGGREIADVVYGAEEIRTRVSELGREITSAYADETHLLVIGTLKGSCLFLADLVREISRPLEMDFLAASSYGSGTVSSGEVRLLYGPTTELAGRTVLLVEDIVDSGATLARLVPRLRDMGAARVDVCALLHKRHDSVAHEVRFVGFDAPKRFLVGYGLDHAEAFRHLPYIASL
ncbi:MAG: hypoxanthine phosphoribosyltransferase [Gemmatimonadota bacterium]